MFGFLKKTISIVFKATKAVIIGAAAVGVAAVGVATVVGGAVIGGAVGATVGVAATINSRKRKSSNQAKKIAKKPKIKSHTVDSNQVPEHIRAKLDLAQ